MCRNGAIGFALPVSKTEYVDGSEAPAQTRPAVPDRYPPNNTIASKGLPCRSLWARLEAGSDQGAGSDSDLPKFEQKLTVA